jgi:hypothetical protein
MSVCDLQGITTCHSLQLCLTAKSRFLHDWGAGFDRRSMAAEGKAKKRDLVDTGKD